MNKRKGCLIGYFLAGDPTPEQSLRLALGAVEAGVDILEIGIPSERPVNDGDIIRRAHRRALRHGDPKDWLPDYMRSLRASTDAPVWAMAYRKDFIDNGAYEYYVREGLIDALVIPDMSDDELAGLQNKLGHHPVDVVRFANPATGERELSAVAAGARIIYAQLYAGATGEPFADPEPGSRMLNRLRPSNAFIVAGFGLNSAEKVAKVLADGYDGAVVGSTFVSRIEFGEWDSLFRLIAEMKLAAKAHTEGAKQP